MRMLLQRVAEANVRVGGVSVASVGPGLLVFLGVGKGDSEKDADYLSAKLTNLRVFEDSNGKMNCSVVEVGGSVLVVSQFTLYGDCRKGRRPGFDAAEEPAQARLLYEYFVEQVRKSVSNVETGVFQADMQVSLINDGPVTFLLESPKVVTLKFDSVS